jgi:hypothetical protein
MQYDMLLLDGEYGRTDSMIVRCDRTTKYWSLLATSSLTPSGRGWSLEFATIHIGLRYGLNDGS